MSFVFHERGSSSSSSSELLNFPLLRASLSFNKTGNIRIM
jgi:hypothetical protein